MSSQSPVNMEEGGGTVSGKAMQCDRDSSGHAGFEGGGRCQQPKNVGGFRKLENARKQSLPGASRRLAAPRVP